MIRRLYLESEPWIEAEKRIEALVPRISHPERAFPRFKKRVSPLPPILMCREFDQVLLDGFASIESVVYALRDLGADRAELLAQPKGGPSPDALALHAGGTFPIEAKRVRGDEGFYRLQDEIDSRRALDPRRLAQPSVSVRSPFSRRDGDLELLSDDDLAAIGERFAEVGQRWKPGQPLVGQVVVSSGHTITLELSDRFGPGHLDMMGTAGTIDPLDTSSLEVKVADKVREAAAQLSAWHDDGVNRPSDLAFIQVEFPGHMIFHHEEAEDRIVQAASRAGERAGIRVKVTCSWA